MPQTGMDWWDIAGVLVTVVGVWIAWRQYRKSQPTTRNSIKGGNRNAQRGGSRSTENRVEDGDDNEQSG